MRIKRVLLEAQDCEREHTALSIGQIYPVNIVSSRAEMLISQIADLSNLNEEFF